MPHAITTFIYPEGKHAVSRGDRDENHVAVLVHQPGAEALLIVRLRVNKNGAISLVAEHSAHPSLNYELFRGSAIVSPRGLSVEGLKK